MLYLSGMKPIKLSEANADFFERAYEVVKLIPRGRVTSYGAIAAYLGAKRSSRMVGWAMNAAHSQPGIPAHRVVNRNGELTGKLHFGSPDEMENRLRMEGIEVKDDRIADFKRLWWNPVTELEL
jgi:methylated-DNA-protein-cysteine methyltransferase related protein